MQAPLFMTVVSQDASYRGMARDNRKRHEAYCDRHGYNYCLEYRSTENLPWFRIEALVEKLRNPDNSHVFMIDADSCVVDTDKDMREALPEWAWLGITIHPFAWARRDWHLQAGTFYVRNTPESLAFFERVLALRGYNQGLKEWHDQGAMNWLMLDEDPSRWQKGLHILDYAWNNTVHWHSPDRVILAAWHGHKDGAGRRTAMQDFWQDKDAGVTEGKEG